MEPETSLVRVERSEAAEAAHVLVDSHIAYPPFVSLFADVQQRRRALLPFLATTIRDATQAGIVEAVVSDGPVGVAAWLPPAGFPWSLRRKLRAVPDMVRVAAAAPRAFRRFAKLGVNVEANHPSGDHWYLVVLGVRPSLHGQGVGTRLLEHGLTRCDRDGLPCYLETADPTNLGFYRRRGFEVVAPDLALVPGGPRHLGMLRPAATG